MILPNTYGDNTNKGEKKLLVLSQQRAADIKEPF
jgi:hypothetical protein